MSTRTSTATAPLLGDSPSVVSGCDLDVLTASERAVWVAVEVEGRGVRQTARDRGVVVGTVSNQLAAARERVGRLATAEDGGLA